MEHGGSHDWKWVKIIKGPAICQSLRMHFHFVLLKFNHCCCCSINNTNIQSNFNKYTDTNLAHTHTLTDRELCSFFDVVVVVVVFDDCWLACLPAIQSTVNMLESDSYTLTSFNFCRQPRSKWFRVWRFPSPSPSPIHIPIPILIPIAIPIVFPLPLPLPRLPRQKNPFNTISVMFCCNWM